MILFFFISLSAAGAVEDGLVVLRLSFERHYNLFHPRGHTFVGHGLEAFLPLLVGEARVVEGALELAVGEYCTPGKIEFALNLHYHIDVVGRSHSLVEHRAIFYRIVVGIGRIDIGHHSHRLVGSFHVAPTFKPLVGRA